MEELLQEYSDIKKLEQEFISEIEKVKRDYKIKGKNEEV